MTYPGISRRDPPLLPEGIGATVRRGKVNGARRGMIWITQITRGGWVGFGYILESMYHMRTAGLFEGIALTGPRHEGGCNPLRIRIRVRRLPWSQRRSGMEESSFPNTKKNPSHLQKRNHTGV